MLSWLTLMLSWRTLTLSWLTLTLFDPVENVLEHLVALRLEQEAVHLLRVLIEQLVGRRGLVVELL